MRRVMGVAFEPHGRLFYLDPGDDDFAVGDEVLFPTENGPEVARCVWGPVETDWGDGALPTCPGRACEADLRRDVTHRRIRAEIRAVAERLIAGHGLPMTVIATDFVDRSCDADRVAVVYFKALHRVDFRPLLPDLARALAARVDLRQVGSRDIAALAGGVGVCGREFCCTAVSPAKHPLTGRVAKEQEVASQALQYSGTCGRIKCCLTFEQTAYAEFLERAPEVGSIVDTPFGEGVVSGHALPADAVWVRTEDGPRAVAVDQTDVRRPAAPPAEPHPGRLARFGRRDRRSPEEG